MKAVVVVEGLLKHLLPVVLCVHSVEAVKGEQGCAVSCSQAFADLHSGVRGLPGNMSAEGPCSRH